MLLSTPKPLPIKISNHTSTYLLPIHEIIVFHIDDVVMFQTRNHFKFSVLVSLVLKDLLDGHCFPGLSYDRLEHHPKRAVANDFLSVVREVLRHLYAPY